ncbi:MAG TPA: sigma-70 family RNA polymerase sigma factor [Phycisphaerae bacterium]|nr:sigma-70 family RNA polymerase sigma factor [Phycisphaerae bacterium]
MELQVALFQADIPIGDADGELIERAKHDRQAFAMLYRKHYARIAGYIHRRVGDPHVTEDLVADTFMTALRCLPKYRHRGAPLSTWLYRVATTSVNRWVRRQRRWFRSLDGGAAAARVSDRAVGDGEADREQVRTALLALAPRHQSVLSLHYLEGLSVEEVSQALGCRLGTVKSRLSRGREALREKLLRGGRC